MKTPPLLLGATLLFWGWQTDYLWASAIMGAVLEGSRLVRSKWEFSDEEFSQVWGLCTLLFLGAAVYMFTSNDGASAVTSLFQTNSFAEKSKSLDKGARMALGFIQWWPFVFFPIIAAQCLSQKEEINLTTFSYILRRKARKPNAESERPFLKGSINPSYPYFGICLAATSTIKVEDGLRFYLGASVLIAWGLWNVRSRRFSAPVWALTLLVSAGAGLLLLFGLLQAKVFMENMHTQWLEGFGKKAFDPKESRTSIGQIGKMKLSGRIVLRVEIPKTNSMVSLLREASYSTYRSTVWIGQARNFGMVYNGTTNETSWLLRSIPQPQQMVTIATYLPGGQGILPTPNGIGRFDQLPVFQLETNRLGAVRVSSGPGLVIYQARYGGGRTMDAPPNEEDFAIPTNEAPAIAQIVSELALANRDIPKTLRTLENFFQREFNYTTWLTISEKPQTNETALARFLLKDRRGHCEFFATATVLLLRKAGIPARYAVGYSVQEAAGDGRYVVRERHGHAWCLYYNAEENAWRDFDTTPGTWSAIEEENAHWWQSISDSASRLWFEFSKLRWGNSNLRQYLLWVVGALIIVFAFRLFIQKRWRRSSLGQAKAHEQTLWPGLDSEFFELERRLIASDLERNPGETLSAWLKRIEPNMPINSGSWHTLLTLHYRYRFDPNGLSDSERASLRTGIREWLAKR